MSNVVDLHPKPAADELLSLAEDDAAFLTSALTGVENEAYQALAERIWMNIVAAREALKPTDAA